MLRPYHYGANFTLRADHNSLRWTLDLVDASGRLARWLLRLSEFEYEVQYRPEIKRNVAYAMLRLNTDGLDTTIVDNDISCYTMQLA